jgi:zinc transport system substrate-binding protein
MKKIIFVLLILIVSIAIIGCDTTESKNRSEGNTLIVAASVVPEAGFIEAIAGDLVEVLTVIPPGNSPANYQPTTKEMQKLSDADIYFLMQMPTEEANILPKIKDFNADVKIVNLRESVSNIYDLRHTGDHQHNEEGDEVHEEDNDDDHEVEQETVDPHIWLSPKRAIVMVQVIAEELSKQDPDNSDTYKNNAEKYIKQIEELHEEITSIVNELDKKTFMVYHGSYGYFADDYGLDMIAIEADGKAATASDMKDVIEHAKEGGIKVIFYQDEFDDTQAQTVAKEIGGKVVKAVPLSKDYLQSQREFARALKESRQ